MYNQSCELSLMRCKINDIHDAPVTPTGIIGGVK